MTSARIYLDYAATSPIDPRVVAAMRPWIEEGWGNPSSLHAEGRAAREAVEAARAEVARLIGARPNEIVFTGSGTEANNLALLGLADGACAADHAHVVASSFEHPSVLEPCRALRRREAVITLLPVTPDGIVLPETLHGAMRPNTRLVSIMAANNVLGTLQPIRELSEVAHAGGARFHTDAVQAVGYVPIDVHRGGIDALSMSAHKLGGPKGVGALFVRDGIEIEPLLRGGGQEGGRRSATENVAGIVGFGEAARIAREERVDVAARLVQLRDRLHRVIAERVPETYLIGDRYRRLPGHLCLGFSGLENDTIRLMLELDAAGVAVSTGSACSAHTAAEPSYVLTALGFDQLRARGALRITLGRRTTAEELDRFAEILPRAVKTLRPVAKSSHFAGVQQ